ncbi:unnamed protein product [Phytophthora fragariaefolia]|uniref:Unnamed protein product n=1 Tax=Phytophthora fragariaefolia TaxID=1490495 RepID=A0A9W6WPE3_9STRA|nr:unnamed protein product [Phytophthora fragariaefolia]
MKRWIKLLVSPSTETTYGETINTIKVVLRTANKIGSWFELESSWQKLKSLVNRSTTLDDCVVSIIFRQTVNEKLWQRRIKKVGVYINSEYDEGMNALYNTVSRYPVDLVKQQYDLALLSTTEYRSYPMGPKITALRPKPQNDKFNDLLSIGWQIADVGSTWGTNAHNNLQYTLKKFLHGVRVGRCPDVNILESDDTHSETCTQSRTVAQTQTAVPTETVVSTQTALPSELDKNPSIVDEVTEHEENIVRTHVMIPYGCAENISKVDYADHHFKDSDKASSNSDEQSATSAESQNG